MDSRNKKSKKVVTRKSARRAAAKLQEGRDIDVKVGQSSHLGDPVSDLTKSLVTKAKHYIWSGKMKHVSDFHGETGLEELLIRCSFGYNYKNVGIDYSRLVELKNMKIDGDQCMVLTKEYFKRSCDTLILLKGELCQTEDEEAGVNTVLKSA